MRLFMAGSSPGGARPKVLINDGGKHWLAKFPSIKDTLIKLLLLPATIAAMPEVSECGQVKNPISVLFMNGTDDNYVPFEGGAIGKLN